MIRVRLRSGWGQDPTPRLARSLECWYEEVATAEHDFERSEGVRADSGAREVRVCGPGAGDELQLSRDRAPEANERQAKLQPRGRGEDQWIAPTEDATKFITRPPRIGATD